MPRIDDPDTRKIIAFDPETWLALKVLGRDRDRTLQELADEAFADLLKKHHRPVTFRDSLKASARTVTKGDKVRAATEPFAAGDPPMRQPPAEGTSGAGSRIRGSRKVRSGRSRG
jgi:hypothetical protein